MDKNEATTRILTTSKNICAMNKANSFATTRLTEHVLTRRLPGTSLNNWVREFEELEKRTREDMNSG